MDNTQKKRWDMPPMREMIKTEDPLWGHYVVQRLGYLFVRLVRNTPITPNQVTFLAFLVAVGGAIGFALGTRNGLLAGAVLINVALALDCADGQLARLRGLSSQVGAWSDYHADKLKDGFLLLAGAYGFWIQDGSALIFVAAFAAIFFHFLRKVTSMYRDNVLLKLHGKADAARSPISTPTGSQFIRSFKHTLLFQIATRTLLLSLGAVFNIMFLAIVIFAVVSAAYAAASGYLNYKTFARIDAEKK